MERILGIDPGSRITGWALVEQQGRQLSRVESGIIRLQAQGELSLRLALLQERLEILMDRVTPGAVAVEDIFTARNARSALALGHARGVALAVVGRRGIPVHAYAPALVKRAVCGHGRAEKAQVQRMVQVLLSCADQRVTTDESDAMAIAICHALSCRIMGHR